MLEMEAVTQSCIPYVQIGLSIVYIREVCCLETEFDLCLCQVNVKVKANVNV
jgi:hypothetical protein